MELSAFDTSPVLQSPIAISGVELAHLRAGDV